MRLKASLLNLILIFVIFISCNEHETSGQPELELTIAHLVESEQPILKIDMNFAADSGGVTHLIYQDQAWGQDSLFNSLRDIKLMTEGKIRIQRDSNRIIIEHDPALERVKMSYSLVQDYPGPTTSRKVYRPLIQPEYFQVFGQHLFLLPEQAVNNGVFDLSIFWNIPDENYSIQSSFGNHQRKQAINDIRQEELYSSVFVGGDFRIYDMELEGNQVAFAIRDTWEAFDDSTMVELLKTTIRAQREFWNDHSQPYFSVTMIPIYEQYGSSWQGTGLTNSFALAASNNEHLEFEGLVYLLNHELQHNWIGLKIKNENEEEQYWFSEGFTDYYTLKNITVNRIYDLDEKYFIREFNSKLKNLYDSPVVASPNSEINYDNFWKDGNYTNLPYLRGAVFAFILDQKILKDSMGESSLDDVMKKLFEKADTELSHSHFLETVQPYLKEDVEPFFNRHIVEGVPFDMVAIFKDLGLEYGPDAKASFGAQRIPVPQLIDSESNVSKLGLTSPGTHISSGR